MGILERVHVGIDSLAGLPPLIGVRKLLFDLRFRAAPGRGLCRGVYDSFEEAARAAPPTRPQGYDHPAAAQMYDDRRRRVHTTDYPPLFWLARVLAEESCNTIVDFGGHHGLSYYAYSRYLNFPEALRWVVSDVPAVVARGRTLAITEDKRRKLSFVDALSQAPAADVFFANGSIQYLAEPLVTLLRQMPAFPRHVLLNMLPVHASRDYFTVQEIGTAFCPYHVRSEPLLMSEMQLAGYECIDKWENPNKRCTIEFDRAHSVGPYCGYYFRRDDTTWNTA